MSGFKSVVCLVPCAKGFPCSSVGKEYACSAGDLGSIPGLGRSPGEEMATHSSILAWKIPWTEEPCRLLGVHFHAMEKEMATHSNILAWRIPGTEEPGGLLSVGSHRVEHD